MNEQRCSQSRVPVHHKVTNEDVDDVRPELRDGRYENRPSWSLGRYPLPHRARQAVKREPKMVARLARGRLGKVVIAAVASILLGVVETYVAALLGYILDLVIETPPNSLFSEKWPVLLAAVGFLFLWVGPGWVGSDRLGWA